MRIAFLLESTCLCGGVKVVLRQAEALSRKGHEAGVVSADGFPHWFDGNIDYINKNPFSPDLADEFDVIIATTPDLVIHHFRHSGLNKTFHLVQGYEGDYKECSQFIDKVEEAYRLPVTKLTVSASLTRRLGRNFPGRYITIGQGIESEIFYPVRKQNGFSPPFKVFLVGALSISIKRLDIGLKAFIFAEKSLPDLSLVRISPVDTRREEEEMIGGISEYHVNLRPPQVAEVFRSGPGLLISPSEPGEGFGLPALEAMACGVPVVLTRIPSYISFAKPVDYACFTEPGDVEAMSRAIIDLASSQAECQRLALRGLAVASLFRFEDVAEKMESAFKYAKQ